MEKYLTVILWQLLDALIIPIQHNEVKMDYISQPIPSNVIALEVVESFIIHGLICYKACLVLPGLHIDHDHTLLITRGVLEFGLTLQRSVAVWFLKGTVEVYSWKR